MLESLIFIGKFLMPLNVSRGVLGVEGGFGSGDVAIPFVAYVSLLRRSRPKVWVI
jgi:hypothetical protein